MIRLKRLIGNIYLFFSISYSSFKLIPSVVVHFWNLSFSWIFDDLNTKCMFLNDVLYQWITQLYWNQKWIIVWSSGQPIFDYLLCTLTVIIFSYFLQLLHNRISSHYMWFPKQFFPYINRCQSIWMNSAIPRKTRDEKLLNYSP